MTYTSNAGKKSTVAVAKIPVRAKTSWTPTLPVLFLGEHLVDPVKHH